MTYSGESDIYELPYMENIRQPGGDNQVSSASEIRWANIIDSNLQGAIKVLGWTGVISEGEYTLTDHGGESYTLNLTFLQAFIDGIYVYDFNLSWDFVVADPADTWYLIASIIKDGINNFLTYEFARVATVGNITGEVKQYQLLLATFTGTTRGFGVGGFGVDGYGTS